MLSDLPVMRSDEICVEAIKAAVLEELERIGMATLRSRLEAAAADRNPECDGAPAFPATPGWARRISIGMVGLPALHAAAKSLYRWAAASRPMTKRRGAPRG